MTLIENIVSVEREMLTFFTNSIRITLIPCLAITNCTMPGGPAFSIDSTSSGEAGILTSFTNTCTVVRTFWVSCTFRTGCCKGICILKYVLMSIKIFCFNYADRKMS